MEKWWRNVARRCKLAIHHAINLKSLNPVPRYRYYRICHAQVPDSDAIQRCALVNCVGHEALHASDMRHDMDHAYCRHTRAIESR
jgi:hypothetical protein